MALKRYDDWALRCRFNLSRIHQRAIAHELFLVEGDPYPPTPETCQPPETMSQMLFYYTDESRTEQVALAHRYIRPVICGGIQPPDPKWFVIAGIEYRAQKGKEKWHRQPEVLIKDLDYREIYKAFRRAICRVLGPKANEFASTVHHRWNVRTRGAATT